jgi:hypothetical protein
MHKIKAITNSPQKKKKLKECEGTNARKSKSKS